MLVGFSCCEHDAGFRGMPVKQIFGGLLKMRLSAQI
jgi:hypothetical protein